MLSLEQIQNLDKASLYQMTSDAYRAEMEGSNAEAFRARVDIVESAPHTASRPRGHVREELPAQPSGSFDPSFDDDASVQPTTAPPISATEELPELVHEYQPCDASGRPVGNIQRFKYRTQAELIDKLSKAHSAASARIRQLSRERRLEEIEVAGASPLTQAPVEIPTTVEGLSLELKAQREQNFVLAVRTALAEFQSSVDWRNYRSAENAKTLVLAVEKMNADPTDPESYRRAFERVRDLLDVVMPVEPAPTPVEQPKVAHVPAPVAALHKMPHVPIATGLSSIDGTDDSPTEPLTTNAPKFYTAAELDRMDSATMRKLLRNPAMARKVDAVYEEAAARRGR